MTRYLLGEHPVAFIAVWWMVTLTGALLIRMARGTQSMADQVKVLNEHRENRKGSWAPPADVEAQDPEMATHLAVDERPDWMA